MRGAHRRTYAARLCAVGGIVAVLIATPAAAQSAPPKITASAGFGQVNPLPIELPFVARTWAVSVQFATGRHLAIEGAASGWHHLESSTFEDSARDRSGKVVVLRRWTEDARWSAVNVSLNALATVNLGRVRLSSGAGAGILVTTADTRVTVTDCLSPFTQTCQSEQSVVQLPMLAVQCVLGADVTLTRRWQAFVAYRLSQPFAAPLAELSFVAGLKIAIK